MEHFPIFALPRELRDKIVKHALFLPVEPLPPNVLCSPRKDGVGLGGNGVDHVFYPSNVPEPWSTTALISLLCANKQLHAEVQELIASIPPSKKYGYTIDVHVEGLRELFPSWTWVPLLTDRVEQVRASIHLHAVSMEGQRGVYQVHQGGLMLPLTFHWSFLNLLDRFLVLGPTYKDFTQAPRKQRDRWISLRKLIVDVITPTDMAPECEVDKTVWITPFWVPSKSNGEVCFLSPHAMCDYLDGNLQDLLAAWFSTQGSFLYERLGSIEICVDGEVKYEWNLAKTAFRRRHRTSYPPWKEEVWKIRAKLGLEIPEKRPSNRKVKH